MEVCTARGVSNLISIQPKLLAPNQINPVHCKNQFSFMLKQVQFNSGLRYRIKSSLRPTTSEETSAERNPYDADEPEPEIIVENTNISEKNEDYDTRPNEAPLEGSLVDNLQFLKFLEEFDIKFDYEDTYSLLVFGGSGAVALWLAAAVVGAIDSIPLFPKVLELIGLGYTIWFSSRYLLFKENRDELVTRVEQIKQQVLGSKDN